MSNAVLSIGEVARRTGVSESTLRAWERDHDLLEPERTEGGHRRYRLDDVQRVGRVQQLVHSGWSPRAAVDHVLAEPLEEAPAAGLVPDSAPSDATIDGVACAAAYRTALRLFEVEAPADATARLRELVTDLGGEVRPADRAGPDAIPVDLSFGAGPPLLPVAPAMSLARMRLQFLLPELVEAARRMVDLSRRDLTPADGQQ